MDMQGTARTSTANHLCNVNPDGKQLPMKEDTVSPPGGKTTLDVHGNKAGNATAVVERVKHPEKKTSSSR